MYKLRFFLTQLRKRLENAPVEDKDSPLETELVEYGYSKDLFKRMAQDKGHHSSNYIMNLFEATVNYLYPGQYEVHQHIVFLIFDPLHGSLSEILFCRLGQGYVFNGGGCSHQLTGRNISSIRDHDIEEWGDFRDWALEHTPFLTHHNEYMMRRRSDERRNRQQPIKSAEMTEYLKEVETEKELALFVKWLEGSAGS